MLIFIHVPRFYAAVEQADELRLRDRPVAVRRTIQRLVMNDHWRATGRHMHIELHSTCTGRQRGVEGHERVLGSTSRISAMSDDLDVAQMAHSSQSAAPVACWW